MSYYFLFSESCDNIWDVDTTYAENEVHYYSGTDTDDEIQIDKEQQEANNTDTVTSLGTIVSDAKKNVPKLCLHHLCHVHPMKVPFLSTIITVYYM